MGYNTLLIARFMSLDYSFTSHFYGVLDYNDLNIPTSFASFMGLVLQIKSNALNSKLRLNGLYPCKMIKQDPFTRYTLFSIFQ
ncbi:hypothetical protein AZE41_14940 [Sporosarcina psychrophila]|nr:hypothetical protein AZE41_14940 [Sporosarcina psychrophila]